MMRKDKSRECGRSVKRSHCRPRFYLTEFGLAYDRGPQLLNTGQSLPWDCGRRFTQPRREVGTKRNAVNSN